MNQRFEEILRTELCVIIPARNEEQSLVRLLPEIIKKVTSNLIVVDNGSSDATSEVATKLGARVIRENRIGYGFACLAAISYIASLTNPPSYICFFDGDEQSDVNDIIRVAKPVLLSNQGKIYCQGSRMILDSSRKALSPMAQVANSFFSRLLSIIWGQKVTDLGPLRVITWSTLKSLEMRSSGYGWTMEMSSKLLIAKIRHNEIPVNYNKRKKGISKISGNITTAVRAAFIMTITFLCTSFFWRPSSELL